MARETETVYDTTSKDRVRYVRHRLDGGSWTDVISTGYRHVKYDTAMDKLDRLRCLSRATISSCAGSEPWESKFLDAVIDGCYAPCSCGPSGRLDDYYYCRLLPGR